MFGIIFIKALTRERVLGKMNRDTWLIDSSILFFVFFETFVIDMNSPQQLGPHTTLH